MRGNVMSKKVKVIVHQSCAGKGWKLDQGDDPQEIPADLAKYLLRSGLVSQIKPPARKKAKK